MYMHLFAHSGETHQSSGQSFVHVIAAWYVLVPVFTIALTLLVAFAVRKLLDTYEAEHRKQHKKSPKHTKVT